jgi:hypothetical protein
MIRQERKRNEAEKLLAKQVILRQFNLAYRLI